MDRMALLASGLLIGAVISIIGYLRYSGLSAEMAQSMTGNFSWVSEETTAIGASMIVAMTAVSTFITITSTLMAFLWSYRRHDPRLELCRASKAYRKALRKQAKRVIVR
jgi:hypothetical protein